MLNKEKLVSEKLEEFIEGIFRFPLKYIRTSYMLIFRSKYALGKIYDNVEGTDKKYVPPLTYFLVSYFVFTTVSYLFWAIDAFNNFKLDDYQQVHIGKIYSIILDYSTIINFKYLLSYGFPVLFSFYLVIQLLSKLTTTKEDKELLKIKLYYFISSIPLLPSILTAGPSLLSGEAVFHGSNENENVFILTILLFLVGFIISVFIAVNQLNYIIKQSSSLSNSKAWIRFSFSVILFFLLFIYSLFSFKTNDDLRSRIKIEQKKNLESIKNNNTSDTNSPIDTSG